jgi:RHS repeat-associated protein
MPTMTVAARISDCKSTGKERDAESGNDFFGARYYTSTMGRFLTPDWAEKPVDVPYAHFGNPQSLNLYSYVQNNPTTVGDPDGHDGGGGPDASWQTDPKAKANGVTQNTNDTLYNQSNNTIVVTNYSTVQTVNADGTRTVSTTTTTATFTTSADNNGGNFSATSQTRTTTFDSNDKTLSDQHGPLSSIGYTDAAKAIGYSTLAAIGAEATAPNVESHFLPAVGSDMRAHPGKYAIAAAEVGMTLTPLPEA